MDTNRRQWKNTDWATYLDCSVRQVYQYKKLLKQKFLPCVEWDSECCDFIFALYKREILPSGKERLATLMIGANGFNLQKLAIKDAYANIMPGLKLDANWANAHNIPEKAIQMMHVDIR